MHFYCKHHDAQISTYIDSQFTYDRDEYHESPYWYFHYLLSELEALKDFITEHIECGIIVNNEKGKQVWPENIAEKEKSDVEKGLPRKVMIRDAPIPPLTEKLMMLLDNGRCYDKMVKAIGRGF